MHPDDETDDIDILHENLRRLRKTVEEQREEIEEARTLVNSMREHLEEEAELRQQWIDVFDMQLEIAGIGLNVPSRAVLQTGARIVTVVGPTNLEDEAAEVHQEFWPKHLGKA